MVTQQTTMEDLMAVPERQVLVTCGKCSTRFQVPWTLRCLGRYCPSHDQKGFWDRRPNLMTQFQETPLNHDVTLKSLRDMYTQNNFIPFRGKVGGKWYRIVEVSLSGRRLRLRMGGGTAKAFAVTDIEDFSAQM